MPLRMDTPLPPLEGGTDWFNSEPITNDQLKGHTVLIHFWSISCGICKESLPDITRWIEEYGPKGLKVVSVHMPRQESDTNVEAVKEAMDAVRKDYVELPYNEPEAAVVDAVSDTFENLMTPAREPPKPLQTITLDAKSIRTIHEQMEHAHAGESAVARGYRDLRTP